MLSFIGFLCFVLAFSTLLFFLSSLLAQLLRSASSSAACHQDLSSVSLSFFFISNQFYFSTRDQPDGMLLSPVVLGNAAGQVNVFVPVAEDPALVIQFAVAFSGFQDVNETSIDVKKVQPLNMP